MKPSDTVYRVIAIVPSSRRLGFAVVEAPRTAIDGGVKDIRSDYGTTAVCEVIDLIEWYSPDLLVIDDFEGNTYRRRSIIRDVATAVSARAIDRGVPVQALSRETVRSTLGLGGKADKIDIASRVVLEFPELKPKLPCRRKIWEHEDYSMPLFEAFALCLSALIDRADRP